MCNNECYQLDNTSFLLQERIYETVIVEVIENMKEAVLDEGIDEQVLAELKHVSVHYQLLFSLKYLRLVQ